MTCEGMSASVRRFAASAFVAAAAAATCLAAPGTAEAVRFKVTFSGNYTQSWVATPSFPQCDIVGNGAQTIRFRGNRVVQVDFVDHKPNDPHPNTEASLPSMTTIERTDGSALTPSLNAEHPCTMSPTACGGARPVNLRSVGLTIYDRSPTLKLKFPNYVLEKAAEAFAPTSQCAGPAPDVVQLEARARIAWPGWRRVLRPRSVTQIEVNRSWPPTREARDWFGRAVVDGTSVYDFLADVSPIWRYRITLRNICRTVAVPKPLRRKLRGISSHGRICASSRSIRF